MLTQLLTNHGDFPAYFKRLNVKDTPGKCPFCEEDKANPLSAEMSRQEVADKYKKDLSAYVGSREGRKR